MELTILGGGWVTAAGYGLLSEVKEDIFTQGEPIIPPAKAIFSQPLVRYGRFDEYTKLGCAAIALALKDAHLHEATEKRPLGVVVSTIYECFESDIAYHQTTIEEDGLYASPNLFSYTLPGIVIGEAAIYFKLTGPTFTVGDMFSGKGYNALLSAADLIRSGSCHTVIAGWLDSPNRLLGKKAEDDDGLRGALFVVLSDEQKTRLSKKVVIRDAQLWTESNQMITSIVDLF
jgi:3-oxoacyl-(acyl-carrier-protein) synthase